MKEIYIKDTVNLIGKEVTLFGWVNNRRDHGKLIFIDFKDSTGLIQCVITPHMGESYEIAKTIKDEYVCKLKGLVKERPEKMQTNTLTGKIEFGVIDIEILKEAVLNPFDVYSDGKELNEELRLKKRYIDLKRPRLHNNLKQRFLISNFFRNYLQKENFIEIETPYLTKTTPEGARDFLVPSRISKGAFYGLPQSPQQYKQLLMISQLEKYFQLTRCFRDEDPRGDRQPEFTQLDMEISFFSQDQIMNLIENMLKELVETIYPEKTITQFPFPRIDYTTSIKEYGTDKPDLRKDKNNPNELAFAFIVDFPMFEWHEKQYNKEAHYTAVHNPFTKINFEKDLTQDEKIDQIFNNTDNLKAMQYDLALNGFELGGGAIRETNTSILQKVFEKLGNSKEHFENQFAHYIEAFSYGVPPHGGIALGFDRLIMILQNEPNIREVIAFPKTGDNRDLMMDSPSQASEDQLKELNIKQIK